MLKKAVLAGAFAALMSVPAHAGHCPKDAAAIDHALSVMNVSDDVKTKVTELRDKGMQQHEAGNHAESQDALSEAMRTLLMGVK